jgi:ATP phosphoribosyltransferase
MRPTDGELRLALPSKGQLGESSLDFLSACGFRVKRGGNDRGYVGRIPSADGNGMSVVFYRADEIPSRVDAGDAHVGITGYDLVGEFADDGGALCLLVPHLGYGKARLVVGVPRAWIDVTSMHDLDEVAMMFHSRHGRSLRVATKFPRLTRRFFAGRGLTEYQIVGSAGATEGAPAAGLAELIVDLSSTGATLAQNHLKEIVGGTVYEAEACLIACTRAEKWGARSLAALERLTEHIEARLRALAGAELRFHLPADRLRKARTRLTGEFACSFAAGEQATGGEDAGLVEAVVFCPSERIHDVVSTVRSMGCTRVLVQRCEFVFEAGATSVQKLRSALKHQDTSRRKSDRGPVTASDEVAP